MKAQSYAAIAFAVATAIHLPTPSTAPAVDGADQKVHSAKEQEQADIWFDSKE